MRRSARFLVGVLALAAPARGADEAKVTTDYDLVYSQVEGTELKLDLVRPAEGQGPFPAEPPGPEPACEVGHTEILRKDGRGSEPYSSSGIQ